jgi:hypothetical protein
VRLYDEHAIKTIYVDGADVRLLVSYTGIAYLTDRFRRTDHWLLEAIHPIAALVLPELAEALRERASAATASGAELTIIGAGYKKGTNLPIQFSVSNIEDADGERLPRASAEFTARFWLPKPERLPTARVLSVHGAEGAILATLRRRIAREAHRRLRRASAKDCAETLVRFIRAAGRESRHGKLVGPNCIGGILRPFAAAEGVYYPLGKPSRCIIPHLVTPLMIIASAHIKPGDQSPAANVEFDLWPQLVGDVRYDGAFVTVTNKGQEDWSNVRLDLNGRPDYASIGQGFEFGPGYVYQFPFLAAGSSVQIGARSFLKMKEPDSFDPLRERLSDLVLVAQLRDWTFGKLTLL